MNHATRLDQYDAAFKALAREVRITVTPTTKGKVVELKKVGRYSDGGGLWLKVEESGGKSWQFRYTLRGVQRHMGLGSAHTVSLTGTGFWFSRSRIHAARDS